MRCHAFAAAALLGLNACAVQTTYIGKSYAPSAAPESFFSWNDVTRPYETMGHITASPILFFSLEKAQQAIEKRAREKGADAVVFEGIGSSVSPPSYTTTERIEHHEDGSATRTSTTQRNETVSRWIEATFIKYRN